MDLLRAAVRIAGWDDGMTPELLAKGRSFGSLEDAEDERGWEFEGGGRVTVQDLQALPASYDRDTLTGLGVPKEVADEMIWAGEPWKLEGWLDGHWPLPLRPKA